MIIFIVKTILLEKNIFFFNNTTLFDISLFCIILLLTLIEGIYIRKNISEMNPNDIVFCELMIFANLLCLVGNKLITHIKIIFG